MTVGDQVQEFQGVYVAHWEIARFEVTVGRTFLRRQRIEKWYPHFPRDFELPDSTGFDRGPGRKYSMRVRVVSAQRVASDTWESAVASWR